MRKIGLSVIAACLIAVPALAQDREPAKLEFVYEPTGQAFTPPPIKFVGPTCCHLPTLEQIKTTCADDLKDIYSYRRRLYLVCVRNAANKLGIKVVEMDDADQVAALYGTTAK